jgi:uncharacterized membrane protein HdeD (DUF308 family)
MSFEVVGAGRAAEARAARLLRRSWWVVGLRGLLAIALGIVALTRPAMTLSLFLTILGVYLLCDGVVTLFSAFHAASRGRTWWPYLVEGLISFGVGVLGLARPGPLANALLVLIAARAIIVGVVEIGTGISARRTSGGAAWLLAVGGVASLAFGLLLLGRPSVGLLALVWSFGIYAIAFGLFLDGEALRARRAGRRLEARTS